MEMQVKLGIYSIYIDSNSYAILLIFNALYYRHLKYGFK